MAPQKVVLLACGSFNPITNMHLRMFELARDSLQRTGCWEVIAGLLSPVNDAYKKPGLAPSSYRCEMVRLATASSDWLAVDQWEAGQPNWCRTRQVLEQLQRRLARIATPMTNHNPVRGKAEVESIRENSSIDLWLRDLATTSSQTNSCGIQVKLLCGGDLLETFAVANLWNTEDLEVILRDFGVVCVTRPDSDPRRVIYESDLLHKYENHITVIPEWITSALSSTAVRRSLHRGESVRYLLPDSVLDLIMRHQLYGARGTLSSRQRKRRARADKSLSLSLSYGSSGFNEDVNGSNGGSPSPSKVSKEVQTRLSALGSQSVPLGTNGVSTGVYTCEGSVEGEALLRLVKECRQCGSRRVRVAIAEGWNGVKRVRQGGVEEVEPGMRRLGIGVESVL